MRLGALALAALASPSCIPEQGPLMRPGENCLECHGGALLPGEPATVADRQDARPWTIAGTVFPSETAGAGDGVRDARVHVTDATGRAFSLRTNRAGNFYSAEPVTFPLRVRVEQGGVVREMEDDVPYGGCNGCHRLPPRQEAPGRISAGPEPGDGGEGPLMMAGENCLECHGGTLLPGEPPTVAAPRPAPPWTVAGTVFSTADAPASGGLEGALVHLIDALGVELTLVTNRAGNFYTTVPLTLPLEASVEHLGVIASMERDVPYGGCNSCHRLPPRQLAPGRLSPGGGDDDGGTGVAAAP